MKEAQESTQIKSQRLKQEQEQIRKQRAIIEAQEEQRLQEQRERTQDSILRAKKGLEELQNRVANTIEKNHLDKKVEGDIRISPTLDENNRQTQEKDEIKDEGLGLTSYPSSESLQEFDSEEIGLEQYWYYALKAKKIQKKMDQATEAFHNKDDYYRDHACYDEFFAEYTKHMSKFDWQIVEINQILAK